MKIEDKIRMILEKARATPFPEERLALEDKAMKLMAKYHIEESKLPGGRSDCVKHKVIFSDAPWSKNRISLLSVVGEFNGAYVLMFGPSRKAQDGLVYCLASKFNIILELFRHIEAQMFIGAADMRGKSEKHAFQIGFINRVYFRLKKINQTFSDSSALIPVLEEQLDVAKKVCEAEGEKVTESTTSVSDRAAFEAGTQAGDAASLFVDPKLAES